MGIVFNIQRYSLYDGPGVRTVVFLKGCPLRCIWCHNPEGLDPAPVLMFNPTRCIGCGDCAAVCPGDRHGFTDGIHPVKNSDCPRCGKCADACVGQALSLTGREMSVDEIMKEVMRDESFYRESGGGLTLSGGEPLYQADFSAEILKAAKENGLHTCVETSGFGSSEKVKLISQYTDTFLFDYKATGEEEHKRLCGVSRELILKNLEMLSAGGADIVLRCPIIPGINDTDAHFAGIAETAKKHKGIREVQLEPYHRLGVSKAEQLGLSDYYDGSVPEKEDMERHRALIEKLSLKKVTIS